MTANYLIILLNYNNSDDTIDCINSFKKSGVSDSSILIIENNSSDNSYERLKKNFPSVLIIKAEKNLGFTGGNNLGLKYAVDNGYQYGIVLNNDTIVEDENSFKTLISEMDNNPSITIGTGRIFYYPNKEMIWYDGGKLVKWRGMAIHYNYNSNRNKTSLSNNSKEIDFVSGCFMCIRLSDIQKLGYMDENFFIYLDDIEYSARAIRKKLKIKYFPKVIIYHKARGEGVRTNRMVYYSIRNRRLLISLHFGIIAKLYFEIVLIFKRIFWFLTGNKFYGILKSAIKDYNRKYFGLAPEHIK